MIHQTQTQTQSQSQHQPLYTATFGAGQQPRARAMTDTELQQQLLSLETETVTPQQTEAYDGCYDLNVLAYTATQQYFDLAAGGGEEKGEEEVEVEENELDVWRRNANGPVTRRVQAVQAGVHDSQPQLYIAPPLTSHKQNPVVSPGLSSWTAVDLRNQQQHMMSQSHHHHQGPGPHYFTATSPTSPPPAQYAFDPIYHSNSGGGYPSSTSSNDPAVTQEEADLKRLRNTAASARFRAKKKKREQSLERAAHEKKTRLSDLETRIRDLEAENRWLKDLIMERNNVRSTVARYEAELERANQTYDGDKKGDGGEDANNHGRASGMVGRGDGNGMGVG